MKSTSRAHYGVPNIWRAVSLTLLVPTCACSSGSNAPSSVAATFVVSGTVSGTAGGVGNATIAVSGAASKTATTDAAGRYSIAGLSAGSTNTYTITVTATGYSPASRSFAGVTSDNQTVVQDFSLTSCSGLTFDDLATFRGLFETSSMCGFTLKSSTHNWQSQTAYGRPEPSIVYAAQGTIGDQPYGEVLVTATNGQTFHFQSVDVYSSVTQIPYLIIGRLNSAIVFTLQNTQPGTFGNFVTVTNPQLSAPIDSLTIRLTNPAAGLFANPVGLDNVFLAP